MEQEEQADQNQGPFLGAALFCDRVLSEVDGTLSLIRVVDRVQIQTQLIQFSAQPQQDPPIVQPPDLPQLPTALAMVIILRRGERHGTFSLQITSENPIGERTVLGDPLPVLLQPDQAGLNVTVNLMLTFRQSGRHWFDIDVDGERLTRVPLEVVLPEPGALAQAAEQPA